MYVPTNEHETEYAICVSPGEAPQPPSDSQRGWDPRKVRHMDGEASEEVTDVGRGQPPKQEERARRQGDYELCPKTPLPEPGGLMAIVFENGGCVFCRCSQSTHMTSLSLSHH